MPRPLLVVSLLAAVALAGCYGQVQRTIAIDSEPEGARCWLNDNEVGRTPVTVPFTWYGTYRVRLEHPGYEPLVTEAKVRAPAFQWIPLDLAYETVVPGVHYDTHAFRYMMQEAKPVDADGLRERAEALRRDATMGAPPPVPEPPPPSEPPPAETPAAEAKPVGPAPTEAAPDEVETEPGGTKYIEARPVDPPPGG
ncbi:MAG: PEGA domain-containing protein [Planctomycetes bacterium]|nr:PEGA domain-containing protein [Planctomycetota bacterium]